MLYFSTDKKEILKDTNGTTSADDDVLLSPEFKELWEKIKYKTTYSVDFDSDELIEKCCAEMQTSLVVSSAKLVYTKAGVEKNNPQRYMEEVSQIISAIMRFAKLPDWFKIETPLGSYNPDWAALMEKDGEEKLYFVIETKGNILSEALYPTESAKITCGHRHFEALGQGATFEATDDFNKFMEKETDQFG